METQKLLGSTGGVFLIRVAGALAQFMFQIMVARKYGVEAFGVFSIALTMTIVSSIIARWGADQWVLRELPASLTRTGQRNFISVLGTGLAFVLVVSLIVSLCLFLMLDQIVTVFVMDDSIASANSLMGIMIVSVAPFALINFFSEVLRTVDRHISASILQVMMIPFISIALLLGLYQFEAASPLWIAIVYISAISITCIVGVWMIWSVYQQKHGEEVFVWIGWSMFRESNVIAVIVLLSTWLAYADVLFLGLYREPDEVGLYAAAQRIVLMLSFVLLSFNSLLGPRFARLNQEGRFDDLFGLYRIATYWMVVLGLPVVFVLAAFSEWFLSWFGSDFRSANTILWVLLLGQIFNVLTGPVGVLMMMMHHTDKLKVFTLLTVMLHLLLLFLLVPKYGATGAAVATCTGMFTLNILCWRFVASVRSDNLIETVAKDVVRSHD